MPLYEFFCSECNISFDLRRKTEEDTMVCFCPKCNALSFRIFTPPAVQFIGPGFFVNDYGNKPKG